MIVDSINDTVKDTHSCVIYGIYGRWGEGKTSLMKFIESRLLLQGNDDNLYIVHFNPWLVGKQDALLREFFSSVRTSVDDAVRHFFDKYGSLAILASETIVNNLVPGIGASLGCCIKLAKRVLTDSEDTLVESKKKLSEDLAKSGKHCLVMVDDVDRLDREELHSVLRLVRQVADFDNFIYILAMDVDIVSKSIGSYYGEGCSHDGRKFIDKIVQVPIVLPPVTEDKIKDLLCENLSCCVGKYCVEDDEYASTFPHWVLNKSAHLCPESKKSESKMKEEPTINYAFALKHYNQNGRGRSMKKFCEEEGYDYEKFMQYSRRGQKEYSVLKEADERQSPGGFIPLVVDGAPEGALGIRDVRVRFTNGMELSQGEGDINELLGMVRKILG